MEEHHHKVFNANDYIPKRFGLNYAPPQIIIEYLAPSTGKLYHHKMRLHKFTKEKSNAEVMKELYERHQVYLDKKKVSSEQLIKLIERLKKNFVPKKKKIGTQGKKEQKKEESKTNKDEQKDIKNEEKKEIIKETKKEIKKEEKSEEIEEDFDFGEVESSEKSKDEKKGKEKEKEKEIAKPKEPDKKIGKKMDDELEEEEEEYGFDEFEDEDLNKLDDSALKKKKAEMDIEFEKNNIKKGDANFQYDIRKEFDHEQYAAEWDDDSY